MANIDKIKARARREAWKPDSMNPFRKNIRSSTWQGNENDPELGMQGGLEGSTLSNVQTEPIPESPSSSHGNGIRPDSKREDYDSKKLSGEKGRSSDPASDETVVDRQSTRPKSQEEKARHRFLSKWRKGKNAEVDSEDEVPKKTPWYKGKEVPHQPFTFRNQLQRTIFNSCGTRRYCPQLCEG
jgi:Ca2+:H+ antiporter